MEEAFKQAFIEHPVGVIFGIGFCILCFYFGMSLLWNGWPKLRK